MKSVQKITRLQLKINQNIDFILLGLVSAEPDYKLSLALNRKFRISLKNTSPLRLNDDRGGELTFSRFSNIISSQGIVFNLISNRSGQSYLLKKLKNIDYILQIHDSDKENIIKDITTQLREIDIITAVFNIDLNIKDKHLQYLTQ
jgi:hypothetical protein